MDKNPKTENINSASGIASLQYEHPLERWLQHGWVRQILRWLTQDRPGTTKPHLECALRSYADPQAPIHQRTLYWPIHQAMNSLRGSLTPQQLAEKIAGHPPTLRGIIATAKSIAHYGLTTPQQWLNPLFVVWNFTNRCNLRCQHCYQKSSAKIDNDELNLEEKLRLIDQLGANYVAMVAFAGGEPTISPHLEPALERCKKYGMHTTIATHGMSMTPDRCRKLADLGLRYVEVSLDSIHPEKHDKFRGVPGAWQKAVAGIKNVVATDGMRAGIAMCVHKDNLDEVDEMIDFAIKLGVSCFAHFNFIPVGRGAEMAQQDLTPQQREKLLENLHRRMEDRQIGIISTAPQFGRICLTHSDAEGLISCSHAGNAAGAKARVVAKYLGGCGAGRTYVCLQPNGNVTPCVYMPQRTMGNIREKSLTKIFQQSPWWDLLCHRDERETNCGICDYRYYCGGCRARSDAYFNRLDHADPGCVNNTDLWNHLMQNGSHNPKDSKTIEESPTKNTGRKSSPQTT